MSQVAPVPIPREDPKDARSNDVTSVKILLGFQTPQGVRQAIHEINPEDFVIDGYSFHTNRKTTKIKDNGGSFSIEPTGEEELTLKIKYHRRW